MNAVKSNMVFMAVSARTTITVLRMDPLVGLIQHYKYTFIIDYIFVFDHS